MGPFNINKKNKKYFYENVLVVNSGIPAQLLENNKVKNIDKITKYNFETYHLSLLYKIRNLLIGNLDLKELALLINPKTCDLAMQKHGFKLDKYLKEDMNLVLTKEVIDTDGKKDNIEKTADEITADIIQYFN